MQFESIEIDEGSSAGKRVNMITKGARDYPVTITVTGMEGTTLEVHPSEFTLPSGSASRHVRFSGGPGPDTDDETVTVLVTISGEDFDGSPPIPMTVTINDLGADPDPGVFIAPMELDLEEAERSSYKVALNSEPTGNVTIDPFVMNTTPTLSVFDQIGSIRVGGGTRTFTTENWHTLQEVPVTAVESPLYGQGFEADVRNRARGADYESADGVTQDVAVEVVDEAAILPSLDVLDRVDEDAGTITFTLTIDFPSRHSPRRPHVYIMQTRARDTRLQYGEGGTGLPAAAHPDYTHFTRAITFQPADYTQSGSTWTASKEVLITLRDDDIFERDEVFNVIIDAAIGWMPLPGPDRNGQFEWDGPDYCQGLCEWIVITDNDPSGINVSRLDVEVTEEDETGDTYQWSMVTEPRDDVTVELSGLDGTDVTATPSSVTFTPDNWNTPKTVKLTAIADDDTVDDEASVTHTPQGTLYRRHTIDSVRVTVKENDKGVNLSPRA